MLGGPIIETFRFEDENDYDYEIFQLLFAYYHRYPGMLHCTFFTSKDNRRIKFLTLKTFFRHYDILAKTRCRRMTKAKFSRQNDPGLRARIT